MSSFIIKKDPEDFKRFLEKGYEVNERVWTLVLWYRQEKLKLPSENKQILGSIGSCHKCQILANAWEITEIQGAGRDRKG